MKKFTRVLTLLIAILVLSQSMVYASGTRSTKKVWQGPLQVFYNEKSVQLSTQPIIIENRTYLPIRAIAEALNMNVEWVDATRSIKITDRSKSNDMNANIQYYAQEVTQKSAEIADLKAKLAKIEKEKDEKISQLEKDKKDIQKKLDDANDKLKNYGYNNNWSNYYGWDDANARNAYYKKYSRYPSTYDERREAYYLYYGRYPDWSYNNWWGNGWNDQNIINAYYNKYKTYPSTESQYREAYYLYYGQYPDWNYNNWWGNIWNDQNARNAFYTKYSRYPSTYEEYREAYYLYYNVYPNW